jgi:hypothetical protein
MPAVPLTPKPLSTKDSLDYAWKWFQYHAGQRMLAFNFLLVLMGALSVGYFKAHESGSHVPAAIVAFLGAGVTLAFLLLDWRNEDLVQLGRDALISLQFLVHYEELIGPGSIPPEADFRSAGVSLA